VSARKIGERTREEWQRVNHIGGPPSVSPINFQALISAAFDHHATGEWPDCPDCRRLVNNDLDGLSLRDKLRAENARLEAERDEAQKNYQFMVNRAADEKLDGYRELGARAAAAENAADDLRSRLSALTTENEKLRSDAETLALIAEHRLTVGPETPGWCADSPGDRIGEYGPTIGDAVRACVARIRAKEEGK
jgi:hypothetical protein